ncbi:hypothetical protein CEXT_647281, partial [Caerostris extrusa]
IVPVRAPQPYKFGYSIKDHHAVNSTEKNLETSSGQDHEPGTANQNPAAVQVISNTPYVAGVSAYVPAGPAVGYGYGPLGGNVRFGVAGYEQGLAGGAIRGYDGRLVNFL